MVCCDRVPDGSLSHDEGEAEQEEEEEEEEEQKEEDDELAVANNKLEQLFRESEKATLRARVMTLLTSTKLTHGLVKQFLDLLFSPLSAWPGAIQALQGSLQYQLLAASSATIQTFLSSVMSEMSHSQLLLVDGHLNDDLELLVRLVQTAKSAAVDGRRSPEEVWTELVWLSHTSGDQEMQSFVLEQVEVLVDMWRKVRRRAAAALLGSYQPAPLDKKQRQAEDKELIAKAAGKFVALSIVRNNPEYKKHKAKEEEVKSRGE